MHIGRDAHRHLDIDTGEHLHVDTSLYYWSLASICRCRGKQPKSS